jgi:phosphate uptake regulator
MFEKLFGSSSTLVDSAFRDVDRMIADAASMTDLALATILDNQPLEVDLDRIDDRVDEGERMVRRTVLEHLVMNPKDHLVASLVLASVVQDAERLGDVARGLADLERLAREPRVGPFRDELAAVAGRIRPLFDVCRTAFAEDDTKAAQQVVAIHRELKKQLAGLVERVAASELPAASAVIYALAATYLRRLGAHLSNIASTVVVPYDRIRHGDEDA